MIARLTITLMFAAFLVTGCIGVSQTVSAYPPTAPSSGATETQEELAADFDAQAAEETVDASPEPDPQEPAALNPDSLRSYLTETEVRIDALAPEEALLAWTVIESRTDGDAAAPIASMKITDKSLGEENRQSEVILSENDVYLRTPPDDKWLRFSRSESTVILPTMLTPQEIAAASAASLASATIVTTGEEISGVETTHYQLTGDALSAIVARTLPQNGRVISGQMDLWVARRRLCQTGDAGVRDRRRLRRADPTHTDHVGAGG